METVKSTKPEVRQSTENDNTLKGTIVSVGFVLAFIIVSWVSVFWLYLSRV